MTTITRRKTTIAIVDVLERWARYRVGRIDGGIGWNKQTLLGRVLGGMPGTDCPRCKDAVTGASLGVVWVEAPGVARRRVACPSCDGARKVKLDTNPSKVNPALITGSGPRSAFDDDPLSQKVDWLVCVALTEDQRVVVLAQYTRHGTQKLKATRLGISEGYFSRLLGEAHDLIAQRINCD